jgi:D-ornithine 4,5-aminomutase subunit beta
MEWAADGTVMLTLFLPASRRVAEAAALELAAKMNLQDAQVINLEVMQEAEGVRIELKGRLPFDVDTSKLVIPPEPELLSDEEIRADVEKYPLRVVCGTVGEDEHSVGLREIIDIKHGGIERFGIEVHYLGTSVPVEKLIDAAIELNAEAILASTIISHDDIHYKGMKKIHELAVEKGIRDKVTIVAGGTQVVPKLAVNQGIDAGFGRGTHGIDVATFLVKHRRSKRLAE